MWGNIIGLSIVIVIVVLGFGFALLSGGEGGYDGERNGREP